MKSILEELFYGNVCPSSDCRSKDGQTKKLMEHLANHHEKLNNTLTDKVNEDKAFRKQLIENIIKYAYDHMSLITAAVLIKKKFTTQEIIQNYYANVNVFENEWF